MLLNDSPDSKKSLPKALFLLALGLLLLICAINWQHTYSPLLHLAMAHEDFIQGFCIGLGLALEAVALVMLVRIRLSRLKK
jgi:hypothetical protein